MPSHILVSHSSYYISYWGYVTLKGCPGVCYGNVPAKHKATPRINRRVTVCTCTITVVKYTLSSNTYRYTMQGYYILTVIRVICKSLSQSRVSYSRYANLRGLYNVIKR